MSHYLFIDLETIPCQNDELKDVIKSRVKHPASMKVEKNIAKWEEEKRPQAEEEAILKTSFNGLYGEIICLGFAIDDDNPLAIFRMPDESEKSMLTRFWKVMNDELAGASLFTWVGHNICEFDLRFLFHRSVINQVKPRLFLPHNAKPWSNGVFDTLYETMGNNNAGGSLDAISKVLGLSGKTEGMDGSKVWHEYQKGNIGKIAKYCMQDVELTREIYKRLTFKNKVAETLNPFEAA
jgi:predicted PolB exonuclease-like 3'-5' exonuclease